MADSLSGFGKRLLSRFRRDDKLYGSPPSDVLDLYDALLVGEHEVLAALRSQLRTPLILGIDRQESPGELRLVTIYDESLKQAHAVRSIRGRLVELDDAVVIWGSLSEAKAVVSINDGVITEVLLTGHMTGWPKALRPSTVAFRAPNGALLAAGDDSRRAAILAGDSAVSTDSVPPEWLTSCPRLPIRRQRLASDALDGAPQRVRELGEWVEPTQLGTINLHSGSEYYRLDGSLLWIVGSDIDGSPFAVEPDDGRVVRLGIDGSRVVVAEGLPSWLDGLTRPPHAHR